MQIYVLFVLNVNHDVHGLTNGGDPYVHRKTYFSLEDAQMAVHDMFDVDEIEWVQGPEGNTVEVGNADIDIDAEIWPVDLPASLTAVINGFPLPGRPGKDAWPSKVTAWYNEKLRPLLMQPSYAFTNKVTTHR